MNPTSPRLRRAIPQRDRNRKARRAANAGPGTSAIYAGGTPAAGPSIASVAPRGRAPRPDPIVTPSRVLQYLRARWNPLRWLTPEKLQSEHQAFDVGYLRNFALTMDKIEDTDDILKNVCNKRKRAPAIRGYEIIEADDSDEAHAHKETLTYFYQHLHATSAVDENSAGGVGLLLRHMMDAVGKKYSCHEIVWDPRPEGITAELRFIPLWFFENTTGRLRFLEYEGAVFGMDLDPGRWLLTVGDGLHRACSIAYLYKHMPLRDWLIYCGRHGMPGIAGKTNAAIDSPQWTAMENAVKDFASEFSAVMSKDDTIEAIDLTTKGEIPHPKLVERMDRAMAALWRGADLSTISAGQGHGQGASLQWEESQILESSDSAMLSEALNRYVDRWVIYYRHGVDQPLAYIQVNVSTQQNVKQDLEVDEGLYQMGFPLSLQSLSERYNRPLPDDDEEVLPAPTAPPHILPDAQVTGANEGTGKEGSGKGQEGEAPAAVIHGRAEMLAPAAAALREIVAKAHDATVSDADLEAFVKAQLAKFPELAKKLDLSKLANPVEAGLGAAAVKGAAEGLATGARRNPLASGKERRGKGQEGQSARATDAGGTP